MLNIYIGPVWSGCSMLGTGYRTSIRRSNKLEPGTAGSRLVRSGSERFLIFLHTPSYNSGFESLFAFKNFKSGFYLKLKDLKL